MTHSSYPLPPERHNRHHLFRHSEGSPHPPHPLLPLPHLAPQSPVFSSSSQGPRCRSKMRSSRSRGSRCSSIRTTCSPRKPQPPVTRYTSSWVSAESAIPGWGKTPCLTWVACLRLPQHGLPLSSQKGPLTQSTGAMIQGPEHFLEAVAVGASGQATCPLTLPAAVPEIRGQAWHGGRGQGLREREKFRGQKRRVVGRELGQRVEEGGKGGAGGRDLPAARVLRRPTRHRGGLLCLLGQRHTVPFRLLLLPPGPFQEQRPAQPPPLRPPALPQGTLWWPLCAVWASGSSRELVEWGWENRTCWVGAE